METQMNLFHNTLDLPESELKVRQLKAGSQNEKILQWFRQNPGKLYTPFDIIKHCFNGYGYFNAPITSIRRAMTDLTKLGYLEKTKEKRAGEYGELNYCWKLLIKSDEWLLLIQIYYLILQYQIKQYDV